ncbi:MAG: flagellar basal-body MS-ring/collar protein FliF [Chromatiales bacterium]|jgi:flagellar M-ring protein FliF
MAEADAKTGMSMMDTDSAGTKVPNLGGNPIFKQLAAMVGIAVSVALGVAVVMWTQTPNYSLLHSNLGEKDAIEVMDALQQNGIEYKVDPATGAVMVESSMLQQARLKLAAIGLPRSSGMGFELLQEDSGFGSSRLVEMARHQRAIEGELARTISTISAVQTARVHLAIPKQSVFIRKRKIPSASVTLRLYSGRKLEDSQVDAIVHMVASSVPELEPGQVTVVDQKGRLLSDNRSSDMMKLSASQFEYTEKVEGNLRDRIYDILVPILGEDKVRAQVTADIDFTVTERTRESYNPDLPALRSEQVNEESSSLSAVQGVPGALTNQPPAAGAAPENAAAGAEGEGGNAKPVNSSRQATRNYELDKTISHTKLSPTNVRRLSVAVVIDDLVTLGDDGKTQRSERTPEEIERISELVKEAIGFDGVRGDTVKVINSSFMEPEPIAELPPTPMWEESWFWDIVRQVGGILVVLLLIFVVLRPAMKRLTSNEVAMLEGGMAQADGKSGGASGEGGAAGGGEGHNFALGNDGEPIRLPGPGNYESVLEAARHLVDEDPKRVAQLIKSWNVK